MIDILPIGEGAGLILNEYPLASFTVKDGDLHILRWVCADSEAQILALFNASTPPSMPKKNIEFIHLGGQLCMIDALNAGSEITYQPLSTELPPGKYVIESHVLNAPRTELLVHRFRRMKG